MKHTAFAWTPDKKAIIVPDTTRKVFDWSWLLRLKYSESQITAGSESVARNKAWKNGFRVKIEEIYDPMRVGKLIKVTKIRA